MSTQEGVHVAHEHDEDDGGNGSHGHRPVAIVAIAQEVRGFPPNFVALQSQRRYHTEHGLSLFDCCESLQTHSRRAAPSAWCCDGSTGPFVRGLRVQVAHHAAFNACQRARCRRRTRRACWRASRFKANAQLRPSSQCSCGAPARAASFGDDVPDACCPRRSRSAVEPARCRLVRGRNLLRCN